MFGLRFDRIANELTDNLKIDGSRPVGRRELLEGHRAGRRHLQPAPDVGLYASWGQGFLPPTTEELANNPDAQGGFNKNLVPATSRGEEVGVRGGFRRAGLRRRRSST